MDRRSRLETTREVLATAILECESKRDLPALTREYRAVMAEIDDLRIPGALDPVDELAAEREKRRSG